MPFTPIASPKCPACKISVFPAESVMAGDRKPYHRVCVRCVSCQVALTPGALNDHDDKLFCNACYERNFNSSEFTVDYYTGIVTPEDIERQAEKERLEREKMERALRDKNCPTCANKVYPEQAIVISEVIFHKTCVKCIECMRQFEGKDMILSPEPDQKPYCKFCFAKMFGISALDITELVQIAPAVQIIAQGL